MHEDCISVTFNMTSLANLIRLIAEEVARKMEADRRRLNGRVSYNIQEAAKITGLSVGTLRECRARGKLKGSVVGRKLVFFEGELVRLIQESAD